ncbi:MAG TPA: hypothetical protein GXX20_10940 [Clostridiaceae bacterium]|nr:hypothetical protein [Clostridiaceae bacterium]
MKQRLLVIAIVWIFCLNLTGCQSQNVINMDEPSDSTGSSVIAPIDEKQPTGSQSVSESEGPQTSKVNKSPEKYLVSYWDTFAENYGGSRANYEYLPMDVDLLPLYLAGMQHENSYVRWVCSYKAFEYFADPRRQEIITALQPLLTDPDEHVRDSARFSMEVLAETFSGPEFVYSPNGKYVAFNPYRNTRFNDGKLWIYSFESHQLSMILQLISIGGDSGGAGYINWSPDGQKLAVGNGGRTWSDTVIFNMSSFSANKQSLYAFLAENSEEFGYKIGEYQWDNPAVHFLEWSPDSKKALLSYYFAEDMNLWQTGVAVYNCETDTYERIIPGECSYDDYPQVEKPVDFQW